MSNVDLIYSNMLLLKFIVFLRTKHGVDVRVSIQQTLLNNILSLIINHTYEVCVQTALCRKAILKLHALVIATLLILQCFSLGLLGAS